MIKTYKAKKTMDFLPAGLGKSVVSMVKDVEFEYDSSSISADIPSEFYVETDTWKTLVIPATASGVAFSVEKEWVMNPSIDPVKELANFCAFIYCKSKAPVAITNFKIEIWTYNDLDSTTLKSTWVQQINALGTTHVLNGGSTSSQIINIEDVAIATRIKIKISGTPDSNIEEDYNFQIYPYTYDNYDYSKMSPEQQSANYGGFYDLTINFKGLYRTKLISTPIVKDVDNDITIDITEWKKSVELTNYKHTEKMLLERPGSTGSILPLSGTEKFQIKNEGYGTSNGGVLINKNDDGTVIEAITNYSGQFVITVNMATAGWHNIKAVNKNDYNYFQRNLVSFYVNPA
jgi:hypothetical protein